MTSMDRTRAQDADRAVPEVATTLAEADLTIARRLASLGISPPTRHGPAEIVRRLSAVQSQDYAGAKWSIALRGTRLTDAIVDAAIDSGRILRTHVLRPTWHFVLPEDIRWLLDLTRGRVHALNASMYRALELDGSTMARAHEAITRALSGGYHLTREDLGAVLADVGISATGQRLAYIVMAAELDALICSGPRRGSRFTYALLDERAPLARSVERDEGLAELARRFFTARGPATLHDLSRWSSLTVRDARVAVESVRSELVQERISGKPLVVGGPARKDPGPVGYGAPAVGLRRVHLELQEPREHRRCPVPRPVVQQGGASLPRLPVQRKSRGHVETYDRQESGRHHDRTVRSPLPPGPARRGGGRRRLRPLSRAADRHLVDTMTDERPDSGARAVLRTEIVVIGAGQAGLSAAYHLTRRGLQAHRGFVVLDGSPGPGGAWQHRWPSLTVATANRIHDLPGMRFTDVVGPDAAEVPANTAVPRYFAAYEKAFGLPVYRPVRANVVCDRGDRFLVETDRGGFSARGIINATGTWETPYIPEYPGAETFRGAQLHTKDYRSADEFAGRHVIIVGAGISAIQLLDEISRVTSTTWVTRRPPEFREGPFDEAAGRAAVALVEERVRRGLPPGSVVSVTGLPVTPEIVAMRRRGVLERKPMFSEITETGVRWADGTEERADVILWCTGFRGSLDHLAPLMLREPDGGIVMTGRLATQVAKNPAVHLVGYGPSASTIGANRAGRAAAEELMGHLGLP
jgi:thioredoxin reductase